jgi:hypothetical protein
VVFDNGKECTGKGGLSGPSPCKLLGGLSRASYGTIRTDEGPQDADYQNFHSLCTVVNKIC